MEIPLADLIFLGLIMLLGEPDIDYLSFYKDADEWAAHGWIHRN
jgi:hypothetical protein